MSDRRLTEFEKVAASQRGESFFRELWGFLRYNKKWWLLPLLLFSLLFGAIGLLAGSAVAPFIYTIF